MAAIFFDIDGTLWDRENRIPESTKEAVLRLREKGHLSFLCSGRTKALIRDEKLLGLGFDGILGGCGTQIVYRGERLFCHEIEKETLIKTVRILKECRMPILMEGETYMFMDPEVAANPYGRYIQETLGEFVKPLTGNEDQWRASKLTVMIPGADVERAEHLLKDDYQMLCHGKWVMELVPKGFSKAKGIQKVCEALGISRDDTVAFGDSINDRDMLEYAACGIAMGNGTEAAKEAADYITDDIHQDGIYHALEHFGLI
ncbi:Putative bifunctional phosphatase/peptidyl-prolyl cis-trans isomerase [uncultured Roseburia sp.]|uniref:Cof-type HAD-IIB family hydrolase n=1 Tax=Brotonthovivens ammoniilytica TaxID=2981725 RepID=A0ABT2TFC7_9FIRM|nr:Cof-type HAD-IIB family hydrolase [Brotonthovivens ammoniilytica]MCU6760893.1 Cof-type HAD-IIB family hydrolase [Brotonthovivens ammoniilytica]SCI12491.1 Putative bifunctional phosphatase/peptidyl-prolyl cis-trans isomerase [uncultured Roseburia sp.]